MPRLIRWWNDHQVLLYFAAIMMGGAIGLLTAAASTLEAAVNPALGMLLFATFLGVPVIEVKRALRDWRFLGTIVIVNFVIVPIVVFGLSRFVADNRGLLVGLLLTLLTPCVDYVIVFTGLAGGARAKLLSATPLLMLLQLLLLPAYLFLFAGNEISEQVAIGPFVEAFLILIVIPLIGAGTVQALARRHVLGGRIQAVMAAAMVPLMMVTLASIVGSQIAAAGSETLSLVGLLPLYAAFPLIMLFVGLGAGRAARLDASSTRAVIFSGATRNSLVVLPLALALPSELGIAPLAVVTQTMVELVAMLVLVRLVPSVTRSHATPPAPPGPAGPA